MPLINYITRVQFGYGALELLADELALAKIDRALIVSDKPISALGMVERVRALVGNKVAGIYDETPGNPNEVAVRAATELFISSGADGLIAIGGGSALDLAKAVAVMAAHDGPLKTFAAIEGGTEKNLRQDIPCDRHSNDIRHGKRSRARRDHSSSRTAARSVSYRTISYRKLQSAIRN